MKGARRAGIGCLRVVRSGLLRSYVQVITYKYTQLLWLCFLLRLVRSSLERLRPKPRTPKCRFSDRGNSQSTVYDYTNCACGSELLQIQWMVFGGLVWARRSSVRKSSRDNRRRDTWNHLTRYEVRSEAPREGCGTHGCICFFLELNVNAISCLNETILSRRV
jgi:hypothetical protein